VKTRKENVSKEEKFLNDIETFLSEMREEQKKNDFCIQTMEGTLKTTRR
jgi:hypothetical protein